MPNHTIDQNKLSEQYADASNLNARIALHKQYSTAEKSFREWQFNQFNLPSDARILVLGCGPGNLWAENREHIPLTWNVTLTDFSQGMAAQAQENLSDTTCEFQYMVVNAEDIPFSDESFDAVTANHMLYHVPDRNAALSEIRRVLVPGGQLYATTNGETNMQALREVMDEVLDHYTAKDQDFTLENGREQLSTHFAKISLRRRDDALVVPEVTPLIAYALSSSDVDKSMATTFREEFISRFENGVFCIEKDVGMFIAEKQSQ